MYHKVNLTRFLAWAQGWVPGCRVEGAAEMGTSARHHPGAEQQSVRRSLPFNCLLPSKVPTLELKDSA